MKSRINFVLLIFLALLLLRNFQSGAFADPKSWFLELLLIIPGVVIGISFHEFSHGWVAYKLGDPTPKFQGRVTINPKSHIDPMGLIALMLAGFGWGVPVEINPNNFRYRRRDEFLVSIAGVTMNLFLAVVFAFIMKLMLIVFGESVFLSGMGDAVWQIMYYIIWINLVLMIFNLIPVPPLDGFNIITEVFHLRRTPLYYTIYNNGFFILMALILFGVTRFISIPIMYIMNLLSTYIIGVGMFF